MNKLFCLVVFSVLGVVSAMADNYKDMEPLKLEVPEIKPELVQTIHQPLVYEEALKMPLVETKMDFDFFKSKTNKDVKPYGFWDDVTFVGVPVFLAGVAIKGDKANFRQDYNNTHANTRLISNFKTSIDDYTQFFGPVMTVGLKIGGLEGRSDWPRLIASSLLSYGIMAGFVNGIKYTASEMRPDGSTANSWPSGHTATSFVGATILHKEYGLTRSPWFSVAGYGVATATGVMRILNNRHWISDVLSGAGIGMLSTELGYFVGDVLFKKKGLLRNDLVKDVTNPSFFSISMGFGYGLKSLSFDDNDLVYKDEDEDAKPSEGFGVDFHTASVVDAEGAYFFNKYIGVGGRLRVRAMTAKSWQDFVGVAQDNRKEMGSYISDILQWNSSLTPAQIQNEINTLSTVEEYSVESDHLTEFSASAGVYFNIPLSKNFSLGTKLLIGRTLTQELDINAHYVGDIKNMAYTLKIADGYSDPTKNDASLTVDDFSSTGKTYDEEWDYLTLGGNNSTTYGTGISLTYRYKSNFAWKIFCDYDFSQKQFTFTADPARFMKYSTPGLVDVLELAGYNLDPIMYKKKKDVHYFTIGASFAITF